MTVTATYPGVYVEEVPSGVRTISGVSTSVAMFIGRTSAGEMDKPTRCLSYTEFRRIFTDDATYSDLPRQVKLFFDNGGAQCFVVRVANGPRQAAITLEAEDGTTAALTLTARGAGDRGNLIRAAVDYNTPNPETTFNLQVFRWERDSSGVLVKQDTEVHSNLSMDPRSSRYAPRFIDQNSRLVTASTTLASAPGDLDGGYSQSGRPLSASSSAAVATSWDAIVSATGRRHIRIQVDGGAVAEIDLASTVGQTTRANLISAITSAINGRLVGASVSVAFAEGPALGTVSHECLRITSSSSTGGVVVLPGPVPSTDASGVLMLGTAQGGIEVGRYATHRPAPSGVVFDLLTHASTGLRLTSWRDFAACDPAAITAIVLGGVSVALSLGTTGSVIVDASGGMHGVREKLALIAAAINNMARSDRSFAWRADVWGSRLAIVPTDGPENVVPTTAVTATATPNLSLEENVRLYSLGVTSPVGRQSGSVPGLPGSSPALVDYEAAFEHIDREVDLFNLMIIPRDHGTSALDRTQIWGPASVFCQKRRAFLLMDPPDWGDPNVATAPGTGVSALRTGLVKDHAAVYYPRLRIFEGGGIVDVDPAGAVAGLMSRIDSERGVWKAPAGTEADIRGIAGVGRELSDGENGVLNPRAINAIRVLPGGVVSWGARTMDGDDDFGSEWKYVPVRRLALYLEESLFRGLQWAVFEPNDDPLWSQIRLNVGAFMHSLFRQGAFQGKSPREAYLVKCDKDTTTQDDINRGYVNVLVGFAPLKPAEFVIVRIQQLAGQLAA